MCIEFHVKIVTKFVGETGRRFGTRLGEHRKEVEATCSKAYTRSRKLQSTTEHYKSAITDHAVQMNHVIDWNGADIVDKASDRRTRWIKEAIHIRKEGELSTGMRALTH